MRFTAIFTLAAAIGAVAAIPLAEPLPVAVAEANAFEARDGGYGYPDKEKEEKKYGDKYGWGDYKKWDSDKIKKFEEYWKKLVEKYKKDGKKDY